MGNSHNIPFGRRAVLGGGDVKGNSEHGQAAEVDSHPLPTLWQALVSQDQERLRPLRLRRHR
ncbi:uncharacterized protein METZ01_LOCUS71148 [marine metagenome]|uniref:Uncharacterized protein n=1 Tax=marine metagenome TaxID=408172 RepID=A0A381TR61_9ZZZZ